MTSNETSHKPRTVPVRFCYLFAAGLLMTTLLVSRVEGQAPAETTPNAPATEVKCMLSFTDLKVAGIEGYVKTDGSDGDQAKSETKKVDTKKPLPELALFHTIRVKVDKLQDWLKQKCGESSAFVLYIDGNAFKGMEPSLDGDNLQFDLRRNPNSQDNKSAWTAILSRRPKAWAHEKVPVTVGLEDGQQLPSSFKANLTVINYPWFVVFVLSFLAALAVFWWLASISDILRDSGPQPDGLDAKGKPNRKRYSLARTQMACWFFIIASSYVFIWMVTSDLSGPTAGVLGLMGISAATGLGAAVIDSGKRTSKEGDRAGLEQKKKNDETALEKLNSEIAALKSAIAAVPPPADLDAQKAALAAKEVELVGKQKEIGDNEQAIQEISETVKQKPSRRFLDDILSDDDGVSFHRFQIAAWTVVLIFVFVAKVYNDLSMPEFDGTLLALMGISGGTYIGFKLPDQQG